MRQNRATSLAALCAESAATPESSLATLACCASTTFLDNLACFRLAAASCFLMVAFSVSSAIDSLTLSRSILAF
jgi:hypothetical protein